MKNSLSSQNSFILVLSDEVCTNAQPGVPKRLPAISSHKDSFSTKQDMKSVQIIYQIFILILQINLDTGKENGNTALWKLLFVAH